MKNNSHTIKSLTFISLYGKKYDYNGLDFNIEKNNEALQRIILEGILNKSLASIDTNNIHLEKLLKGIKDKTDGLTSDHIKNISEANKIYFKDNFKYLNQLAGLGVLGQREESNNVYIDIKKAEDYFKDSSLIMDSYKTTNDFKWLTDLLHVTQNPNINTITDKYNSSVNTTTTKVSNQTNNLGYNKVQ